MRQDTVDVVKYLCNRFHRRKDHCSGSFLGECSWPLVGARTSELIYAYVGTGQVINVRQTEETAYQEALQAARSQHNRRGAGEDRALPACTLGPEPNGSGQKLEAAVTWVGAGRSGVSGYQTTSHRPCLGS